ncbi:tyrosine--tRNA ligase [Falsarthrobacter nasiphocae]|uniref:Tyrosine--tRNA ligase n=1 Tax=Falsarthrobacter nasiphocae TaxID=189863 RepID=A0AAE3YIA8_9MICC|nr:tyrosine--tRNA ligase [Falsarthrobacter nasiphocae]MDR6892715.1 tyrosyl-tRNA synthetase [Falsarthrobacter nasiphocae]
MTQQTADREPTTSAPQQLDPSFPNVYRELEWRGLLQVTTDAEALEAFVSTPGGTFYCGFDPTAPSLHLGNLVQILVMRRLQLAGLKPLALVGGSTGLVGDPRQTAERVLNPREVVEEWVAKLQGQVERYLDFDGAAGATLVNNLDWTGPMSALDFLRDVGKHFRVGTMIKKDIVATRLNSEAGISYTEFSYQVLQGMDYLELFRRHDCRLQSGGSDQWGNLTSGTELIRKVEGESVHALGTPLITNSDGTKFGKSEGNAIWLDPEMCSPYRMYQFWLNTTDADVVDRLKVFTFLSREQIEEYAEAVAERPFKREAQKRLAFEVTALVHGEEAAHQVIAAAAALFGGGDLSSLDPAILGGALAELPSAEVGVADTVLDAVIAAGFAESKTAARRFMGEGAVSVNNERVSDETTVLSEVEPLALATGERVYLVSRGKKNKARVLVTDAE